MNATRALRSDPVLAALIGLALTLPFLILEMVNRPDSMRNDPGLIVLFGVLWLAPTLFIMILMPMIRAVRAGRSLLAAPFALFFRSAVLVFIALFWSGLVIDQMPCFLGVPNCD